jgi:hypothetical protein
MAPRIVHAAAWPREIPPAFREWKAPSRKRVALSPEMRLTVNTKRQDARRAERRKTQAASTMRTDGSGPLDVVVLDLSQTGVRIATSATLEIGQEISIGLAGAGVTRAYVAWASSGEYGCAFDAPLGTEDAARAFSRSEVVRLGPQTVAPSPGDVDLKELYRQHRFWALPLDAVLMTFLIAAGAITFLYLRHVF